MFYQTQKWRLKSIIAYFKESDFGITWNIPIGVPIEIMRYSEVALFVWRVIAYNMCSQVQLQRSVIYHDI